MLSLAPLCIASEICSASEDTCCYRSSASRTGYGSGSNADDRCCTSNDVPFSCADRVQGGTEPVSKEMLRLGNLIQSVQVPAYALRSPKQSGIRLVRRGRCQTRRVQNSSTTSPEQSRIWLTRRGRCRKCRCTTTGQLR